MTVCSPYVIVLTAVEEAVLTARARAARSQHRDVVRARIVLASAAGTANAVIAAALGIDVDTVRKWRRRFAAKGIAGLDDLPRSGRPRRFTAVQVAQVKALLVRRWLHADAIKPWQHRSWIFPRDPDFATKAARVLDLYARCWEGETLGPADYVIGADEKSQLQALRRRHPGLPPAPGRTLRVEFEYRRGGTLAYFAGHDVHRAQVIGQIAPKTGIEPFTDLVAHIMTTEPYASARRVFWVVDNGSSHNGQRSIDRMDTTWPTATLVHLPVHASRLNQVYFSILQRKAISPGDFTDLDHLAEGVLAFQDHYNNAATPFDWTYTRDDLNTFLRRLGDRDRPHQRTAA